MLSNRYSYDSCVYRFGGKIQFWAEILHSKLGFECSISSLLKEIWGVLTKWFTHFSFVFKNVFKQLRFFFVMLITVLTNVNCSTLIVKCYLDYWWLINASIKIIIWDWPDFDTLLSSLTWEAHCDGCWLTVEYYHGKSWFTVAYIHAVLVEVSVLSCQMFIEIRMLATCSMWRL